MDTLDRTFWITFEQELASLTPLVDELLARADWAADDLYTSADGVELVKATWTLFGLRDRLVSATQARDDSAPSPEPFTDEDEVREKLADSIANLIEVRSRIEAGTFRKAAELAALDRELASALELLRLITRDVRRQERTQGQEA